MDIPERGGPTCNRCGVLYDAEYEGSCQEDGCGGWVSWQATVDRLAEALDRLTVRHQAGAVDDDFSGYMTRQP